MHRNLHPRFQSHIARARRLRIIGGSLLVTCLLVGTCAALTQTQLPQQVAATLKPIASIVSSKLSQLPSALSERIPNIDPQLPSAANQLAASATSFPNYIAEKARNLFCRWLDCGGATEIAQQPAIQQRATLPQNVKQPSTSSPPSPTGDAARSATTTSVVVSSAPSASNSASPSSASPTQVIQQPVIERTIEKVQTVIQGGISEALLDARLLALTNDINSRMNNVALAGAYQTNRTYDVLATALRIDELSDLILHNPVIDGGSITGASVTGTVSALINTAAATIASLTATELVATNATTTSLYVSGTATIGSGTGLLQANTGVVSALSNGSNGQVLKVVGGALQWSTDLSGGGGGASAWATTTDDLALYPADPTQVVLVGSNATTTSGNILEVNGNSLVRGAITAYGAATAPLFTATSSSATSTFPRLNVSGSLGLGSDYVTDLTGSGLTIASGALTLDTSGDWSGTLGGYNSSQLLANSFSTTSADFWRTNRNFFATSSADYWKTANNFFSTTSADYWETQQTARTADDLTNNSIEDLNDVAAITENYGDLFYWNGAAWADIATSSLAINTSNLIEGSNLFFTNARADARINATSSIGTLTAAPNLTTLATSLSGFLKATAGVLTTAFIDLAADVTGVLGVNHGGTGWANIASAAIPYGNGTSALATTSAGTNGQVLALLNGVPTWAATSTLSTISGTLGVGSGGTGAQSFSYGLLLSPGGTSAPQNIATSSLGLLTTNVAEGANLYYTDARVQTYLAAQDKGFFFSTTSADAWKTNRNFFATTSADYWKTANNFFSTTSSDYYRTVTDFFSTTSATYFAHSSTTIPKTYAGNTFTGAQSFTGGLTSSVLTLTGLNGPVDARNGIVGATTSIGVLYGGTALTSAPSYGNILVGQSNGTYALTATSSLGLPTFGYLFPSNATSTALTFSGGFLSLASSTIGNGTQSGGLTISGGATTTGALVVQGTATSTFSSGLDIATGCFSILGTCLSSGGSSQWTTSGSAIYYSAGNVGIGTSTPWAKLSIHANNGETNRTLFAVGSSTASVTSTLFSVDNTGLTTIGDSSGTGDANFQFAGDINAWSVGYKSSDKSFNIASSTNLTGTAALSIAKNGNTTIVGSAVTCTIGNGSSATNCSSSDARLKTNIAPLQEQDGLAAIMALNPVSFEWNAWMQSNGSASTTQYGFIAQDVQNVFPTLVSQDAHSGYYKLDYQGFAGPTIKAIQELNLKLEDLATTTATSTDSTSFTGRFFSSLFARITAWLADASNGITDLYATIVHAHRVNTDELCVGSTCVTQLQFLAIVAAANASAPSSPPAEAATQEPLPANDNQAASTTDEIDATSDPTTAPPATSTPEEIALPTAVNDNPQPEELPTTSASDVSPTDSPPPPANDNLAHPPDDRTASSTVPKVTDPETPPEFPTLDDAA